MPIRLRYEIDHDASDWGLLYVGSIESEAVADRLNQQLMWFTRDEFFTREEVRKKMVDIMSDWAHIGATDSEPLRELDDLLDEIFA